jgi:uncharacterized protein YjbI with pentapeptide repeats
VAPAFSISADFAIDKPAGEPCPNLQHDFRCSIHSRLRQEGFPGCVAYDCFGAGQHVTQVTFAGRDWRRSPDIAGQMFAVFAKVRQLHELLWYLNEALTLDRARALTSELDRTIAETERRAALSAEALQEMDLEAHRRVVTTLLRQVSELVRGGAGQDRSGADLIGADLRQVDLVGADLRGAHLVGADLRGANLTLADLTGADLRGAKLGRADLADSLFLTQSQVDSARGDVRTKLPPALTRPENWGSGAPR